MMVGRRRDGSSPQLWQQEREVPVTSCQLSGSRELSGSRVSLYGSELAGVPYVLLNRTRSRWFFSLSQTAPLHPNLSQCLHL